MTYDPQNIFARILRKEMPSTIVYEDDLMMVIPDINPRAPTHLLVLPKINCCSFDDFVQLASPEQVAAFFKTIRTIAVNHNLQGSGYRLVMNHGGNSGQEVFHFHVHILGGARLTRHSMGAVKED